MRVFPQAVAFYSEHKDEGLVYISIHVERGADNRRLIGSKLDDLGVEYPTGLDKDKEAAEAYGVLGTPTTVVVGPDGRVMWIGGDVIESDEIVLAALEQLDVPPDPWASLSEMDGLPNNVQREVDDILDGRVDDAVEQLLEILDGGGRGGDGAQQVFDALEGVAEAQLAELRQFDEDALYYDAQEGLEDFIDDYALVFSDLTDEASSLLATYEDDEEKQDGYAIGKKFHKAADKALDYYLDYKDDKAVKKLEDFLEDYPDSPYADLARELLELYR